MNTFEALADFHSHVLPAAEDGAARLDQSAAPLVNAMGYGERPTGEGR